MHVGASGEHVDAVTGGQQLLGKCLGALHRTTLALGEQLAFGDLQSDRLGGDHVLQSGPPCWPGKTAESIFFAYSSLHRMIPARGPPSVL